MIIMPPKKNNFCKKKKQKNTMKKSDLRARFVYFIFHYNSIWLF